jgi:hypothetical protein
VSQDKLQQAIEVLKPLAKEESTLSAIQILEDLLKNPESIQDLVFSISGSGKRGRPATITDAQVIEIGKRIEEAGKRVTGYSIRAALGGKGRTDRYNTIWMEYLSKGSQVSGDPKNTATKQQALKEISRLIATQDNRATDCPIFAVQQLVRIYGLEADYAGDNIAWISDDDCIEASAEEAAALEAKYQESYEVPKGWSRTHYSDTYEFVTACFTEQGCKDHIQVNGHNLNQPRIYAYGSFRNEEWKIVRDALLAQSLATNEK